MRAQPNRFHRLLRDQDIDVDSVRKALPFREGDKVSKDIKEQAQAAVKHVTGRDATDVAKICCTGDSDYAVFIGLPGKSSQVFTLSPAPKGEVTPPPELTTLHRKMDQAEEAAVKRAPARKTGRLAIAC